MAEFSSIDRRAARIKLILMDCDGVLTDGRVWLTGSGEEQKAFNVRDGLGIELLHRAGIKTGIISGRSSEAVEKRVLELKIHFVEQGVVEKVSVFNRILSAAGVDDGAVAFVGDDLNDIPLMQRSEFAIAVNDAADETKAAAHYVTKAKGGYGAIREVAEIILKAQGRWSDLIKLFDIR